MLHLIYALTFLVDVVWETGIMTSLTIRDLHDQYQRMGTNWGVEIYSLQAKLHSEKLDLKYYTVYLDVD
jgi:hypothetical protein